MTHASTRVAAREKVQERLEAAQQAPRTHLRHGSAQDLQDRKEGLYRIRKQPKNRRLYDYRESRYIRREDLVRIVKGSERVRVEIASTGEDVTFTELLATLAQSPGVERVLTIQDLTALIRKLPD